MLASLIAYSSLISAQPSQTENSEIPSAPDTGAPESDSSPGGTRIDKNSTCKQTKKNLTSLLSIGDFTLSEYPTFWFYIPYYPEELKEIEFIVKDKNAEKLTIVYQDFIQLTDRPGIVKISIPSQSKYSLEIQKNYNWELRVTCVSNLNNHPDIIIAGEIRRLPTDPELEKQLRTTESEKYLVYIDRYIYYDAVTHLASLYQSNPNNEQLKKDWENLLEILGKKDLVDEPIVNAFPD